MSKSNYQLSDAEKKVLDHVAHDLISVIREDVSHEIGGIVDPYIDGKFDQNKFTAMVWYIGDKLAFYWYGKRTC